MVTSNSNVRLENDLQIEALQGIKANTPEQHRRKVAFLQWLNSVNELIDSVEEQREHH